MDDKCCQPRDYVHKPAIKLKVNDEIFYLGQWVKIWAWWRVEDGDYLKIWLANNTYIEDVFYKADFMVAT